MSRPSATGESDKSTIATKGHLLGQQATGLRLLRWRSPGSAVRQLKNSYARQSYQLSGYKTVCWQRCCVKSTGLNICEKRVIFDMRAVLIATLNQKKSFATASASSRP